MTRGKMGTQAALRRESQEVRKEIETYQRNVKRLTEENRELRQALADEKTARANDVRVLRVQLNEGLSPELAVLRREAVKQSDRASRIASDLRRYDDDLIQFADNVTAFLVERMNLTVPTARTITRMLCFHIRFGKGIFDKAMPPELEARDIKRSGGIKGQEAILRAQGYLRPDIEGHIAAAERIAQVHMSRNETPA